MSKWILLFLVSWVALGCNSTSDSTGTPANNGGSDKIDEAYQLSVLFEGYLADEKLYKLRIDDVISIPAAPAEVVGEGDVIRARDGKEGNQLRNEVLAQPPKEPFKVWVEARPAMNGTDWIIRKYKIE